MELLVSSGRRRRGLNIPARRYSPRASTNALVGDPTLSTKAFSSCFSEAAHYTPGAAASSSPAPLQRSEVTSYS
jgi:hypothetical protein